MIYVILRHLHFLCPTLSSAHWLIDATWRRVFTITEVHSAYHPVDDQKGSTLQRDAQTDACVKLVRTMQRKGGGAQARRYLCQRCLNNVYHEQFFHEVDALSNREARQCSGRSQELDKAVTRIVLLGSKANWVIATMSASSILEC